MLSVEHRDFLRAAAVTSVVDATLLSSASARIGRCLQREGARELVDLTGRLGEFIKFVHLAHDVVHGSDPAAATYLDGFERELLSTCDRIRDALVVRDFNRAATELDWISAILGDYPSFAGEVALVLRDEDSPAPPVRTRVAVS